MPTTSTTPWPHAPTHQLAEGGTFIVTARTHNKAHHFRGPRRLATLQRALLTVTQKFGWQLEAWAVFSNHYHFVAHSPPDAESLSEMLGRLHAKTAAWVNRLDGTPNRRVWFNFWETRVTYQNSLLARLSYVHQNAVKHGLVPVGNQYPWCSARWFEQEEAAAMVKSIYRFKTERIKLEDEFEVGPEW